MSGPAASLDSETAQGGPIVSAIIIFLNERPFLEQAISSVFAQTYQQWELLLVDDGSSDGSSEMARAAAARDPGRVKHLKHPGHANLGMSASRNLGILHARGDYVAFLDGDDVWLPQKLERQVAALRAQPHVDMVYGDTELWYSWEGPAEDTPSDSRRGVGIESGTVVVPPGLAIRCYPLGGAPSPAMCSFLIRRHALVRVGGCETVFRGMFEDQALLAKLYQTATILVTDECLARYRIHSRSSVSTSVRTGNIDQATHGFLVWLDDYLRTRSADRGVRKQLRRAMSVYRHPLWHGLRRGAKRIAGHAGNGAWKAGNRVTRALTRKSTGTLIARPNPIEVSNRFALGSTMLEWRASRATTIEVHLDKPDGALLERAGPFGRTKTGTWVVDGTSFYLQDVSDGLALRKANTIAVVRVGVRQKLEPLMPQIAGGTPLSRPL